MTERGEVEQIMAQQPETSGLKGVRVEIWKPLCADNIKCMRRWAPTVERRTLVGFVDVEPKCRVEK
jgi:hypothetical protein